MNNLVQFSNGVLSVSDDAGKQTEPLPTYNPPAIDLEPVQEKGEALLNPDAAEKPSGGDADKPAPDASVTATPGATDTGKPAADAPKTDDKPVDAKDAPAADKPADGTASDAAKLVTASGPAVKAPAKKD